MLVCLLEQVPRNSVVNDVEVLTFSRISGLLSFPFAISFGLQLFSAKQSFLNRVSSSFLQTNPPALAFVLTCQGTQKWIWRGFCLILRWFLPWNKPLHPFVNQPQFLAAFSRFKSDRALVSNVPSMYRAASKSQSKLLLLSAHNYLSSTLESTEVAGVANYSQTRRFFWVESR